MRVIFKPTCALIFVGLKNLFIIGLLLLAFSAFGQEDSVPVQDSPTAPVILPRLSQPPVVVPRVPTRADSLRRQNLRRMNDSLARVRDSLAADTMQSTRPGDTLIVNLRHGIGSDTARFDSSYFLKFTRPVRYTVTKRVWHDKDELFYTVLGLLIFFAILRNTFSRYVGDLFRLYFRTTVRQRQIREQMMQSPLPSLLFNVFFVLSGGVYTALLFYHYHLADQMNLLVLALYCCLGLAIIYMGKFFVLRLLGWVMGASDVAGAYILVVFSTNKIIGILLLPFIVLLAFTGGNLYLAAVSLSLFVVIALFLYRYFLSFVTVSQSLRIHFLHFVVYLLALEVLPLLVINKLLVLLLAYLY